MKTYIPIVFQVLGLLSLGFHPPHILSICSGDSTQRRLPSSLKSNGYLFIVFHVLAVFCLGTVAAHAQTAEGERYQTTVPVVNYTSDAYKKALPAALKQVLLNLTNNASIDTLPGVKKALEKPDNLVQSYHYISGTGTLSLQVKFSPKLVNRLLGESHQSFVALNRPQYLLVWLVEKNAQGQLELLRDNSNQVVSALTASAKQQGFILLWPMMDLEDLAIMSPEQISQLHEMPAVRASQRYQPDSILLGSIEQDIDGYWQGNWKWLNRSQVEKTWQTSGADASSAALSMLPYLKVDKTTSGEPETELFEIR